MNSNDSLKHITFDEGDLSDDEKKLQCITLNEALDEAQTLGRAGYATIMTSIRGVHEKDVISHILKPTRDLFKRIYYWNSNEEAGDVLWDAEKYKPERRMREILPELLDKDAIYQRMINLNIGETCIIGAPISHDILEVIREYEELGFIRTCVATHDPSLMAEVWDYDVSVYLKIEKIKRGGCFKPIVSTGSKGLEYKIRAMTEHSNALSKINPQRKRYPENIGNVPAAGWKQEEFMVEAFLKNIFKDVTDQLPQSESLERLRYLMNLKDSATLEDLFNNKILEYPPTNGISKFSDYVLELAEAIADEGNVFSSLRREDILPTSGAADAIITVRMALGGQRRILNLFPCYPPQFEFEYKFVLDRDTYAKFIKSKMLPDKLAGRWRPNIDEISELVRDRSNNIGMISLINPGNPTGTVFLEEDLVKIYEIAEENGLIVEVDETYWRLVRPGINFVHASVLANKMKVPTVIFRSASKDVFHCGLKFGWAEFHNPEKDPRMQELSNVCKLILMEKVAATSVGQYVLPDICRHPQFHGFIKRVNDELWSIADRVAEHLGKIKNGFVIPANGAMYTTFIFNEGALNRHQHLHIENPEARKHIESKTQQEEFPLDEKLLLYVMQETGVELTPLTGFGGNIYGIRACNLTRDRQELDRRYISAVEAINSFLAS